MPSFADRVAVVQTRHENILRRQNLPDPEWDSGVFTRYRHPCVTADHVPLEWRYDFDEGRNPHFLERLPVNAAFNAGAMWHDGRVAMMLRLEGSDRKSFFGLAYSDNGVDNFTFTDAPIVMPETDRPDTNVYDMRFTEHEDGWIYGLFCTERKDETSDDLSAAEAQCGIARTKNLVDWERLPDLKTPSPQQRNVVLHPEFVDGGKYGLYTRPQDGFISTGSGGGIGWGTCDDMTSAVIDKETVIEPRVYHTIKEAKNGQGPAPIKTDAGWLHLAHGVRPTATGLRYVLYLFMTDLADPSKVIASPGGTFIAPWRHEHVGDLYSVAFSNGWCQKPDGTICIYYATNDTQMWVATSDAERLVDYCQNTPEDALRSPLCVEQRLELIKRNNTEA